MEDDELGDTCTDVTFPNSKQYTEDIPDVPEPRIRAAADSLPFTTNDGAIAMPPVGCVGCVASKGGGGKGRG